MEIDESIRKELIQNLKEWRDKWNDRVELLIEVMSEAKTVEELMFAKRDLLLGCVDNLPVGEDQCYFCIKYESCQDCEYGRLHGVCLEGDSDWFKISEKRWDLFNLIEDLYYKTGEQYEGVEESEE